MFKIIGAIFLLFFLTVPVPSTETPLSGVVRPSNFIVHGERIFVLDGATVSIFALKDNRLIKRFGKAGEGPGEFRYNAAQNRPLSMSVQNGELVVNSLNRLTFFTMEGDYIRELNPTTDVFFFRIKDSYVGLGPTSDGDANVFRLGFRIHDAGFKAGKLIHLTDFNLGIPDKFILPAEIFSYNPVYKDRIYIGTSPDEFNIDVFDSDGTKLYRIHKDYDRIPIGEEYKKLAHDFFRTSPRFRDAYELLSKVLAFRSHFPPIRDLQIIEDRIHVLTYRRQGDLWEMIVLDLKGTELKKIFIPLNEYEPFTLYPILFSVDHGKVYSLVEGDDGEEWIVKRSDLF